MASIRRRTEEKAYRIYMTDMLRLIAIRNGAEVETRYADIVDFSGKKEEELSAEDIIAQVTNQMRGRNGSTDIGG